MTATDTPPAALFIAVYGNDEDRRQHDRRKTDRPGEHDRRVADYDRRADAAQRWITACFGDD